eukprot:gnl/TRDRNA2_/TRDRNA2_166876_c0_seq1.p1 gnl/TRDRNA2_/TRDRNA2_166876_c0~~gnl/TRDRNA2_/TRDRNA2_166876_c0_seq1.p1  ORF type:complete len:177 (-),score=26.30 gnl/TRDRNA2_/TRDRNA2_166876_c0_seq1:111-641(-)
MRTAVSDQEAAELLRSTDMQRRGRELTGMIKMGVLLVGAAACFILAFAFANPFVDPPTVAVCNGSEAKTFGKQGFGKGLLNGRRLQAAPDAAASAVPVAAATVAPAETPPAVAPGAATTPPPAVDPDLRDGCTYVDKKIPFTGLIAVGVLCLFLLWCTSGGTEAQDMDSSGSEMSE